MSDAAGRNVDLVRVYHGSVVAAQMDRIAAETRALASHVPVDRQLLVHLAEAEKAEPASLAAPGPDLQVRRLGADSVSEGIAAIRSVLESCRPRWIHAHGFRATLLAVLAGWRSEHRGYRIIYETHGASAFEAWYRHRRDLDRFARFAAVYVAESLAAVLAHRLLLVSDEIRAYYPATRLRPGVAIPRLVWDDVEATEEEPPAVGDVRRFLAEAREADRRVVVYSGSGPEWQLPKATVRLMDALVRRLGFRALVLTTDPGVFESLLETEAGGAGPAWRIAEVPRQAVLPLLKCCDVGIILREDRVFNRVASPTKLYQYLHAGLAVVTSPGVRAARPFVRRDEGVIQLGAAHLPAPATAVTDAFAEQLDRAIARGRRSRGGGERFTWSGSGRTRLLRLYGLDPSEES